MDNNYIINQAAAQSDGNMEIINQNVESVPHDVKGHENHEVVKFLDDGLEANIHLGQVSFNSSKPVDIISYKEIANNNNTSTNSSNSSATNSSNSSAKTAPKKIWYTETNQFEPTTLLKNTTTGSVDFNSNGILAHRASNDTFYVNYTLSNKLQ